MVAGNTFQFYSESKITFMPTYKYNNGSDDYDTSYATVTVALCYADLPSLVRKLAFQPGATGFSEKEAI